MAASHLVVQILEPSDARWPAVLSELSHDTYHRPEYLEIEAGRLSAHPVGLVVAEGARTLFLPLLIRSVWNDAAFVDATSPYGYPCPLFSPAAAANPSFVENSLRSVLETLAAMGVCSVFVRNHPILSQVELPSELGASQTHGETVWIDTDQDERMSWRGVRSSDKNRINKALRSGVVAQVEADWASFSEYLELYDATMKRLDANDDYYFGRAYFEQIQQRFGGDAMLCSVRADSQLIAGGIFLKTGDILQFHLSGSRTDLSHLAPSRVMVDHMRRWATENGVRKFHLGGGLGGRKDSLFEFKAGFSPLRSEFSTWRLVPNWELHDAACAEAERRAGRRLPHGSGFFPAYRQLPA